ncbi:tetratricopeptide repeat-containing sensor histidine kinase [Chryseobacterium gambrini]|uniref:histidine kinase n=1 Tax=Chryseobacterium gambrini TaxID=373672 RepID=A0A1N7MDZ4_9FLAO|nr:tetratricopeptide repeat protein [Chryseobacterium gambrini]SIS84268.1 Histidine kinase-, DNA gyrase B-, and HSP90-like ATPase [Chryseobacterium gambrini]
MKITFLLFFLILLSSCSQKNNNIQKESIANFYYKKAKEPKQDLTFYYFNLAKNSYLEIQDSLGVGKSLVNMAIIQHNQGDYYGSIETSLEANKFLKNVKDSIIRWTLAASYNNMGICSSYLYDFDNSIKFYNQALKYANVPENKYTYYNNLGDVLVSLKKYKEAQSNFEKALQTKVKSNYAKALNNLARAKYNDNPNYDPLPELYEALKIRQQQNDLYGENSSYATISNYFLTKDKNKALYYAKRMLEVATKNDSKEDQLQALQKIITLDKENYLKYFARFQTLNDDVQITRSKAKNQFAVVRYDVEQKNAENQRLKLRDTENEIDILYRNIGIGSLITILISGFFYYKKRKKRLEQEKEIEVKNTQLKMSKKVHDVVANGLYHMMIDVQNNPEMDKTKILNDIEKMYEESRDISHENIAEKDFAPRFINMITSYSSEEQRVLPVSYKESIWENIPYNTQLELYYIIREILVNMKKHSKAKLASVKFEKNDKNLIIRYTDNGVGIANLEQQKGTGIHNTENRIESIGGDITFEKNPTGGLIIEITIPIQSKYV